MDCSLFLPRALGFVLPRTLPTMAFTPRGEGTPLASMGSAPGLLLRSEAQGATAAPAAQTRSVTIALGEAGTIEVVAGDCW